MRPAALVILLLACAGGIFAALAAGEEDILDKARRDQVINLPKGDSDMAAAIRKARETLPAFLTLAKAPAEATEGFSVKLGVHQGNDVEYFWITPFAAKGGLVTGYIRNTPRTVTNVTAGQKVEFPESDIADWMYFDHGRMKGNYTTCALLKRSSRQEAEAVKKRYGLECEL